VRAAAALAAGLLACAAPDAPPAGPDLVAVSAIAPAISLDIRYAGSDNFVGAPIEGYAAPVCLLARPAAQALAAVQHDLEIEGLGLRVFDCYRPARAVAHFARWAGDLADQATKAAYYPRIEKSALFDLGYIAHRSGHSRGATVDLTLVERGPDGNLRELDMGSPFDLFDPISNTDSPAVTAEQRANRVRLRAAMQRRGFTNLPVEWWHYTLAAEPYPDDYFDLPVAPPFEQN
jgi:D-alanyl-D-alanine dipeptidase